MLARISLSSILTGVHRSYMGLYEAGSVSGLLGLRMGTILDVFQVLGMMLCVTE